MIIGQCLRILWKFNNGILVMKNHLKVDTVAGLPSKATCSLSLD